MKETRAKLSGMLMRWHPGERRHAHRPHPLDAPESRLAVLDGWRGVSIISVLACHLLPLGPKAWRLNELAGPFGMAIFFTLSGFLVTRNLVERPSVPAFFIRRACRIIPLAYLFVLVALFVQGKDAAHYLAYLSFTNNYQLEYVTPVTSPLWSLCVEVHFYLFVGLLVAAASVRALLVIPLLALGLTALRIVDGDIVSIYTHHRADEILAGATVALLHEVPRAGPIRARIGAIPAWLPLSLFLMCCHPALGPLGYLRPYVAALTVATTLWGRSDLGVLRSRLLRYFAETSYALYVIHPIMRVGWFDAGSSLERYLLKRPVGFLLVFALAHLSTYYYEKFWIDRGKRWSGRFLRGLPGRARPSLA